ncbi:DoxX family protein [Kibdelosporangium philippinense]|uniref:DoxX family protein n=1 Tax=Kibdelosporangium philippinense TaxID=211113 RepID=A0ABS8Z914_9PSEU|nr:DoxX family protein [Kibdelosporangium philippinense]MCE7003579.1 DoxX family protein [Kibdelosporangium philippinense]
MNVVLWIAQGLLAAVYLMSGTLKATQPRQKLIANMGGGWVEDFSPGAVKAIGVVEVLGALGLVLPWATGIAPSLTPIAAAGFVVVQILASVVHGRRKEYKNLPVNVILLALALFVAIGRF